MGPFSGAHRVSGSQCRSRGRRMKRRDFITSALGAAAAAYLPVARSTAIPSEIRVVTRSGSETRLTQSEIKEFADSLKRALLHQGSPWYDGARKIWNGMWDDKRPALIASCIDAEDVIHAVNFARTHELLVAVRGGGHSISGKSVCDGGLVVDLSPMHGVRVNPAARTVRVEGGALLSDLDIATLAHGLFTPAGVVSHTGIGGLTLGGGIGRLMRSHGLTIDSLLSVQLVTADGRLLTASEDENTDLFWAVRGGGGNYGVVTEFEYRLHPIGKEMLVAAALYGPDQIGDMLKHYFEFSENATRELDFFAGMTIREDGTRSAVITAGYVGPQANGRRLVEPFTRLGKPILTDVRMRNYLALQTGGDAHNAHGRVYYIKGRHVNDYDPAMIDTLVERWHHEPTRFNTMRIVRFGGAISDVASDETAWPHREAKWDFEVGGSWVDHELSEKYVQWGRDYWDAMDPYLAESFYVNELMDEGQGHVNSNYGHNYARLQGIKQRYDPHNLFRLNANITPKA